MIAIEGTMLLLPAVFVVIWCGPSGGHGLKGRDRARAG
jgi:hypothetical protein